MSSEARGGGVAHQLGGLPWTQRQKRVARTALGGSGLLGEKGLVTPVTGLGWGLPDKSHTRDPQVGVGGTRGGASQRDGEEWAVRRWTHFHWTIGWIRNQERSP